MDKKNNSGVLFKNYKKTNDKQPEYTGNVIIDGQELNISAWVKDGKNGGKYFSLSFSPPYKKSEPKIEVKSTLTEEISKENDLPF